jgi:hypothetical protein
MALFSGTTFAPQLRETIGCTDQIATPDDWPRPA